MASAILFGIVTAVTAAIVAGQQHAYEAQQQITATLAAEELMGRIVADDYENLLGWDGFTEPVGTMLDEAGLSLGGAFVGLGRSVQVETTTETLNSPPVRIRGRMITVRSFDASGRALVELVRFVSEPAEDTLP